ncbi:MAG: PAS domain S-box protein [Phycisphaeraceae bacterium]
MERLQRWGVPVLVGAVGLALTLWAWHALQVRDEQLKAEALRSQAELRLQALKDIVVDSEGVASGLTTYFAATELVEQWEWPTFAAPLLDRHAPAIVSLQWAPRVWEEAELQHRERWVPRPHYPLRRAEHEAVVAAEMGEPHPVLELNPQQAALVIAEPRPQHFPLMYQVTMGDRWKVGFDWWSNPVARQAMERAVEQGEPAVSGRLDRLTREAVTGAEDELVLLFEPVFVTGGQVELIESVEQRWEQLKGFVVVALHPEEALDRAMLHVPVAGIDLHIFDVSAEEEPVLLHLVPSRLRREPVEPYIVPGQPVPAPLHEALEASLGGREVLIYATPTEHFMAMRRSWVPDITLGSGVAASGLLTALLASMIVQTQRVRHEAARRRTHAQQQSALAALGLAGLREPSLQKLMDQAVDLVTQTLAVAFASVLELQPERQKLLLRAGGHASELSGQFELAVSRESLVGYTLMSNEPVVVGDLARETRFRAPALERQGVVSGLSTLIVSTHGEPWGVLGAYDIRRHAFTNDEVNFLQAIANVLGQAIVQHRTQAELRALNETLEQRVAERTAALEQTNQALKSEIAERKRIEQAIQKSEQRFRTLAGTATDAIVLADQRGRITYLNAAAERMFGHSQEVAVGQPLTILMPERYHEPHWQGFNRYLKTREPRLIGKSLELVGRHKNGTEFPVEISLAVHEQDAELIFTGILRDISDRKRAEAALKQSNQELEQFAYVASHDLQEPLRKVEGFSEMLQAHAGPALDEESRDYLQRMCSATGRMRDLISGLLTYSRVTTKRQPFEPVDLNEVAQEVVSDLQVRIEETGGHVQIDALPTLQADSLQMRQLLQNLIGNGLKFHKPGEPPRIKVYAQTVATEAGEADGDRPRCVELRVEDNGIGIEPQYRDQLFVPFRRLHGRGSPYPGTGIGLAVCRKIAERHGGTITFQSTPGEGSTFIVNLPLQPAEQAQEQGSEP